MGLYQAQQNLIDFHNCALLPSVSVCLFKKSSLVAAGIFLFFFFERYPPPCHYPFNVPLAADSSVYGTGLISSHKAFYCLAHLYGGCNLVFSFFMRTFTISRREGKAAPHRCLPKCGLLINPLWLSAFWKYLCRVKDKRGEGDTA